MIADKKYSKAKKITLVMDNLIILILMLHQHFMKPLSLQKQKDFGTDLNLFILPNMVAG